RAGKYIADVALVLHGCTQHVLDRTAVESSNRLKFVEGHGDLPPSSLGQVGGKCEDFLREARNVPLGPNGRKRHADRAKGRIRRSISDLRAGRSDGVAEPSERAVRLGFSRDERTGVPFEKGHVRAEAADGDV